MKRQPGFTLVEMAIVLVIVGLLAAGVLRAASAMRENTGITETRKAIDTIVMALQTFLINNNRLPCPADSTLAETAANYGLEARTASNCDNAT